MSVLQQANALRDHIVHARHDQALDAARALVTSLSEDSSTGSSGTLSGASKAIRWDETSGEMTPVVPKPIAKAFAYFRAMSEPYYNSAILDDAEHEVRLAVVKHANPNLVAAVRAWRAEWDDAPPGTGWAEAMKLSSWHRLIDEIGWDRDIEKMLRARSGHETAEVAP